MSFNIIIIDINQYTIHDFIPSKIKFDDILDFLEDTTEIKSVSSSEEMIGVIVNTLNMKNDTLAHTTNIYESSNYVIQMCHLIDDDNFKSGKNMNEVANIYWKGILGREGKEEIRGKVVCMKSKINNDKYETETLHLKELANILYRNCVKRGIILNLNSYDEFEFVAEPIEFMTLEERMNCKYFEFQALDYIIKVFVEIKPSFNSINEPLSAIFGRHNVKGKGIVTIQNVDGKFIDLPKDIFIKLLAILSDKSSLSKSDNKNNENENNENKKDDKQSVDNFYRILDNKYNEFNKKYKSKKYLYDTTDKPILNELIELQISQNNNQNKT
jgi:hypothetical protein